jgi:hypothetical protein
MAEVSFSPKAPTVDAGAKNDSFILKIKKAKPSFAFSLTQTAPEHCCASING